jgi:hypothetical protein
MLTESKHFLLVLLLSLVNVAGVQAQSAPNKTLPRVFLLDAQHLELTRRHIHDGTQNLSAAFDKLDRDARKAMLAGPFSVVTKGATPPSGDKHDYMSQAPYFWPNPNSVNGLPYIRRDGERNPEINQITDHRSLDQLESAVETLALAYYFKRDEAYAAKAVSLLRTFFLDPATRMKPNLQYAQFVPGVNTGRGIGLIETRGLTTVVDSIGLLEGSKALTETDRAGLQSWFGQFLQWMLESKNGREEGAAKNNHGTYYDVQVAAFALFIGKRELAVRVLEEARQKRIASQIETDGRQPLELARTKAWSYSNMNLEGLMMLATLGERTGIDLWNFHTADGRSIRKALDFLASVALGDRKWPYQEIGGCKPETLYPLLFRTANVYRDKQHRDLLAKLPKAGLADRTRLLQPGLTE